MTFLMAMVQVTQPLQAATVWWAVESNTGASPATPVFTRTSSSGLTRIGTNGTAQVQTGIDVVTVTSTTGLTVGQVVTGTGMPAGATITQIISPTQFRISLPATVTSSTGNIDAANPWTLTGNNFPRGSERYDHQPRHLEQYWGGCGCVWHDERCLNLLDNDWDD